MFLLLLMCVWKIHCCSNTGAHKSTLVLYNYFFLDIWITYHLIHFADCFICAKLVFGKTFFFLLIWHYTGFLWISFGYFMIFCKVNLSDWLQKNAKHLIEQSDLICNQRRRLERFCFCSEAIKGNSQLKIIDVKWYEKRWESIQFIVTEVHGNVEEQWQQIKQQTILFFDFHQPFAWSHT